MAAVSCDDDVDVMMSPARQPSRSTEVTEGVSSSATGEKADAEGDVPGSPRTASSSSSSSSSSPTSDEAEATAASAPVAAQAQAQPVTAGVTGVQTSEEADAEAEDASLAGKLEKEAAKADWPPGPKDLRTLFDWGQRYATKFFTSEKYQENGVRRYRGIGAGGWCVVCCKLVPLPESGSSQTCVSC